MFILIVLNTMLKIFLGYIFTLQFSEVHSILNRGEGQERQANHNENLDIVTI